MARAEVKNAADRQQVAGAATRLAYRERRFLAALREVMATPAGRIVFGERTYGMLARCGLHKTSFSQSASVMAFDEGKRSLGLELEALLVQDEATWIQMEVETRALAKGDAAVTDAAHTRSIEEARTSAE